MAGQFRRIIAAKLFQSFNQSGLLPKSQENTFTEKLTSLVKVKKISKHHDLETGQFLVNSQLLNKLLTDDSHDNHKLSKNLKNNLIQDTLFKELGINFSGKYLNFTFDPTKITEAVLSSVYNEGNRYGFNNHHVHQSTTKKEELTVVIEFSSPNIAKPFHVGHLRSTIIGNFFSNLYEQLGHNVIRLNYLGDWGTQFGLLAAGYHNYGSEDKLLTDPLQHLFEVYVKVNQDAADEVASKNTENPKSLYNRSREIFHKMEKGEQTSLELWNRFRELSIKEYEKIYKRLNIHFSEIHTESMYSESAILLLQHLKQSGLLQYNEDEGTEYVEISRRNQKSKVVMCKSDGTTLYLTRDVAAALHRKKTYNFDKIHYVVDNRQKNHFQNLQAVLKETGADWVNSLQNDFHIGFGRIIGMNTRKGNVIFLKDLLDEAQQQMLSKRRETASSKDVSDEMAVSDILGISSILVQDLKERRNSDYTFSWEKCLNFKADSGVFLQYAHARLCSLKENCGMSLTSSIDASLLNDPAALRLVLHISRYDEVIESSLLTFEPFHIIQYLFQLAHLSNQALHSLVVKGQAQEIGQARLLLFHSTQQVLSSGLALIGVSPLESM